MPSRTINIIDALYGEELRGSKYRRFFRWLLPRKVSSRQAALRRDRQIIAMYREREKILTTGRVMVATGVAMIIAAGVISLIYFNRLTSYEQDVSAEQAKIACLLDRRRNVSVNLARTVRDYAIHEDGIFKHVSEMRAAMKKNELESLGEAAKAAAAQAGFTENLPAEAVANQGAAGSPIKEALASLEKSLENGAPIGKNLAGLMAVAEGYPQLRLSDNFQRFMEALIEVEKELSERRMKLADLVNTYSTQLRTFPGRVFAILYGFEEIEYYKPDVGAEKFTPVEY